VPVVCDRGPTHPAEGPAAEPLVFSTFTHDTMSRTSIRVYDAGTEERMTSVYFDIIPRKGDEVVVYQSEAPYLAERVVLSTSDVEIYVRKP
jgi:hypothetical protein